MMDGAAKAYLGNVQSVPLDMVYVGETPSNN